MTDFHDTDTMEETEGAEEEVCLGECEECTFSACIHEDDGQPSTWQEYQDLPWGGDEMYDPHENDCDCYNDF